MSSSAPWEPILEGHLADQAWEAVRAIARDLGGGAGTSRDPSHLALFWAYLSGAIDEPWILERYDAATTELCAAQTPLAGLALHGGLTGMAWVVAHINDDGSAEEFLSGVDEAMARSLDVECWTHGYDLISGLVGYGVYCLERLVRDRPPLVDACLRRIVDHLVAMHEVTPEGTSWYTEVARLPLWQRASSPDGYFNCGLAHGVPGVVALLGRIAAEVETEARARPLCEGAMRWLHAQQIDGATRGRYPGFRHRHQSAREPARTAWCYGDPGVAVASWSAAARLGTSTVEWCELAKAAATRTATLCGVDDSGICHGAAGLAHLYNRCFQASGDPVFRDAARSWFQHALELGRSDGVGGLSASASLLDGASGIGLALLAALEPIEPQWDRLLLCDLPAS